MYLLRQSHTVPQENTLHAQRHIQYEIRKYLWVTNGLPDVQSGWQMSVWQVYCNPGIGGKDPIASKNKTKIFSKNNSNLWYFGKIWLNFVSQLKEMLFFYFSYISFGICFHESIFMNWSELWCLRCLSAAGQLCRWLEEPLLTQGRFTDYWLINKQRSTKLIFPFPLQPKKLAVKWHSALSLFWKFIFKCFGSLCAQISLEVGCYAPTRHNHIQSNQTPSKKIIKKIIIGPDVY